MDTFIPTWLYIKQHNKTGLKYFGKTVQDPYSYTGSGKHWKNHIKVHGNDVTTTWAQLFTTESTIREYALQFSKENNIVESKEWANLIPENGLDGGDRYSFMSEEQKIEFSKKHSEISKNKKHSDKTKKKMREQKLGNTNGFKKGNLSRTGQKQSVEEREKKSRANRTAQAKLTELQKKNISDKISKALTGVKKTDEHKKKISDAKRGKTIKSKGRKYVATENQKNAAKNRPHVSCVYCRREFSLPTYTRYHGGNCKLNTNR